MENGIFTYLILIGAIVFGVYVLFFFVPFGLWISARIAGIKITLLELVYMKMCRVPPAPIVKSMVMALEASLEIQKDALEAHSLAGGNVEKVVTSMIIAKNKGEYLSFQEACRMDLANTDLKEI
jgi:uncharacterized protein YqfA (UPF0365 family)